MFDKITINKIIRFVEIKNTAININNIISIKKRDNNNLQYMLDFEFVSGDGKTFIFESAKERDKKYNEIINAFISKELEIGHKIKSDSKGKSNENK